MASFFKAKVPTPIEQSDFKFNLNDPVVILHPNEKNESWKYIHGVISHRGYMDSKYMEYPNLYALMDPDGELFPGIPEAWLVLDISKVILEDT